MTGSIGLRRREMLQAMAGALVAACAPRAAASVLTQDGAARLHARPHPPKKSIAPGRHALGLASQRDGWLVVPSAYNPAAPAPLALVLHGATQAGATVLRTMAPAAEEAGVILLAPDSRAMTWDVVSSGYGPDIGFIDRALDHAFTHCSINAARMAVGGFSDGASYALSIGITNGDLFPFVFAFSPGFFAPTGSNGKPRIAIWHGTQDTILPVDRTSRQLVPALRNRGYQVDYTEFDGPHMVRPEAARAALEMLVKLGQTTG